MNEQRIPSVGSLERMIPETIQTDEVAGMQASDFMWSATSSHCATSKAW